MSYISEVIRKKIRKIAGNRCEYCLSHQDYTMGRLQIDHIYPVVKGGENTEENLCLACELCNQYKWTKTEELDPVSNQNVTLFNPRQQTWSEHFTWSDDGTEIVGITSCGRATIIALRLNNSLALAVRKNWVKVRLASSDKIKYYSRSHLFTDKRDRNVVYTQMRWVQAPHSLVHRFYLSPHSRPRSLGTISSISRNISFYCIKFCRYKQTQHTQQG